MQVAVIGGGAAGFFAAISVRHHHPEARVMVLEKSNKLLSKVRISGGGRCNVTHDAPHISKLVQHYPRGGRFLRRSFDLFGQRETVQWFHERGVELKVETDGRMFPTTDDSATVIDCLMGEAHALGVNIRLDTAVRRCSVLNDGRFKLELPDGSGVTADRVIVTTGGHPKVEGYAWLNDVGHNIIAPVPSLFTFNMPSEPIKELMGVVVDPVRLRIVGGDLESTGPLLITHWGMSGPAVLKLSAWGARVVHAMGYRFTLQVNWLGGRGEDELRNELLARTPELERKQVANANPFLLPKRHWAFLLAKAGIDHDAVWGSLARKERNRLIDLLTNDRYQVEGKTTFKEEFVTAGGVDLAEVDPTTMQSRKAPGLYFAGEVLDIDGVTGGFNFQAAWTTAYLAGRLSQGPIRSA
jgi:predicted Rossmann fold flavoprotein